MRSTSCLLVVAILAGCTREEPATEPPHEVSIELNLDALDESGLIGPADGKRALSYEFCVPDDEGTLAEVSAIDPSAQGQGQSPGRVGCTADQVLFIGNTHQPGFREILERLAERPDITRIEPAYFE
jgi:hypothetical protein